MISQEQLKALNDEAQQRGYGPLMVDPNGRLKTTKTPIKRSKEFENRLKTNARDIREALQPSVGGKRLANKAREDTDLLPRKAPGVMDQLRAINQPFHMPTPAEAFMMAGALVPEVEGAEGLWAAAPYLMRIGGAIGLGALDKGKEGAERAAGEAVGQEGIGLGIGGLLGGAGSIAEWAGRKASAKKVGDYDVRNLGSYLRNLYNRPGHAETVEELKKHDWWKVFKRKMGQARPGVQGPLAREGEQYDRVMSTLAARLKAYAEEFHKDTEAKIKAGLDQLSTPVVKGKGLTGGQAKKIEDAIREARQKVAQAKTDAARFRETVKEGTYYRKKAYEGGLPGDASILKDGANAYQANDTYLRLTDHARGIVDKYLGDWGTEAFDTAKQNYAQTAALGDMAAEIHQYAQQTNLGENIFPSKKAQEILEANEPSLSRRLGPDAYQDILSISRGDVYEGGDVQSNLNPRAFVTTHFGTPRFGVGVAPPSGEAIVGTPKFRDNPPVGLRTRVGQAVRKQAPNLGKAARTGSVFAASQLMPPGGNQQVSPQQADETMKSLDQKF